MKKNGKDIEMVKAKKEEKPKDRIGLKNSDFELLDRTQALEQLSTCRDLPVEFMFELKILKILVMPLLRAYVQQKFELIEKYGDRDEKGELVRSSSGMFKFSTNAVRFQTDFERLLNMEIIVEGQMLVLYRSEIPKGLLSENDVEALECLINFKEPERKKA